MAIYDRILSFIHVMNSHQTGSFFQRRIAEISASLLLFALMSSYICYDVTSVRMHYNVWQLLKDHLGNDRIDINLRLISALPSKLLCNEGMHLMRRH